MKSKLKILWAICIISFPAISSEFDSVQSVRMSMGIGYCKSYSIIKRMADSTISKDTSKLEFDFKSTAMCDLPVDSIIPILNRGRLESKDLLGVFMDGPANDTYIELYYSETRREVLHFSSDACFNYASISPSRFYFTQIRDNDPEINSSLQIQKREGSAIYFTKDDQLKLYNLISRYRRMGLGLKDSEIREIQLRDNERTASVGDE